MNSRSFRRRWSETGAEALAVNIWRFLTGASRRLPAGVGEFDGRIDLRGLPSAEEVFGMKASLGIKAERARWNSLDLSYANLSCLQILNSQISDSVFVGAQCRDWRLWDVRVTDSHFVGTNLRDSALGTWNKGKGNEWIGVSFREADLRGAALLGFRAERCSFIDARLDGAEFQQPSLKDVVFSGSLTNVVFDGRKITGRPHPQPLRNVDFTNSEFKDVDFRGICVENVDFPKGILTIPRFPGVARKILDSLASSENLATRVLRAELALYSSEYIPEDSVGVINFDDYLPLGGEELANFAYDLYVTFANDGGK